MFSLVNAVQSGRPGRTAKECPRSTQSGKIRPTYERSLSEPRPPGSGCQGFLRPREGAVAPGFFHASLSKGRARRRS